MNHPLNVGLIGTGTIADKYLVPALSRLAGARLWTVLSRDLQRARDFADKHHASADTPAQTDLSAFLRDPKLHAVTIASQDRLHAEQTIAAARAGKHIFVEKPMTTSLVDAEEVARVCREAAVTLAVGYHLRFHAGHREIANLIQKGGLGD